MTGLATWRVTTRTRTSAGGQAVVECLSLAPVTAEGLGHEHDVADVARHRLTGPQGGDVHQPCRHGRGHVVQRARRRQAHQASAGRRRPTRRSGVEVAGVGERGVRGHEPADGLGLGGDLVLGGGDGGPPHQEEAAHDGEDQGPDDHAEDGDGEATAHGLASAQPVADAPHRGEGQVVAELLAQLADVDVDGALVAVPAVAPHPVEQLPARQGQARC